MNLTSATGGAVISDSQGIGTIVNDDGKPPKTAAVSGVTLSSRKSRNLAAVDALYMDLARTTQINKNTKKVGREPASDLLLDPFAAF